MHRLTLLASIITLTLITLSTSQGEEIKLFTPDKKTYGFSIGGEFPGAKGRVIKEQTVPSQDEFKMTYDFNEGGHYVGTLLFPKFPTNMAALSLTIEPEKECALFFRFVDSKKRVFQTKPQVVKPGKQTITISTNGPWRCQWGGPKEEKVTSPEHPIKVFWICVEKNKQHPLAGSVKIFKLNTIAN